MVGCGPSGGIQLNEATFPPLNVTPTGYGSVPNMEPWQNETRTEICSFSWWFSFDPYLTRRKVNCLGPWKPKKTTQLFRDLGKKGTLLGEGHFAWGSHPPKKKKKRKRGATEQLSQLRRPNAVPSQRPEAPIPATPRGAPPPPRVRPLVGPLPSVGSLVDWRRGLVGWVPIGFPMFPL